MQVAVAYLVSCDAWIRCYWAIECVNCDREAMIYYQLNRSTLNYGKSRHDTVVQIVKLILKSP
jgi:hypothetical protein